MVKCPYCGYKGYTYERVLLGGKYVMIYLCRRCREEYTLKEVK